MRVILLLSILFLAFWFFQQRADGRYDTGYSDGYAEGYNTQCQIRSTLVEGDWDDSNYSAGYNDGRNAGVQDCIASRNR